MALASRFPGVAPWLEHSAHRPDVPGSGKPPGLIEIDPLRADGPTPPIVPTIPIPPLPGDEEPRLGMNRLLRELTDRAGRLRPPC